MEKKINPHKNVHFIRPYLPLPLPAYEKPGYPTETDLFKAVTRKRHSIRTLRNLQQYDNNQSRKIYHIKQILRTSPPLKRLTTIFEKTRYAKHEQILFQTRALRGLKHLTIESSEFKDKSLRALSQCLGRFTNLQILRINSKWMNNVDNQTINILSRNLRKLVNLRTLYLNFIELVQGSSHFLPLTKTFKHLPLLENLHLGFKYCSDIDSTFLEKLGKSFKNLRSLKNLSLKTFEMDKDLGDGWFSLLQSVGQNLKVENLKLDVAKCPSLQENAISGMLQSLLLFSGIERLELDFSWTGFSDSRIHEMIAVVAELKRLKKLKLKFKGCKSVTEHGTIAWRKMCIYL